MYKPRILWVGEASFLNTGYSIFQRSILDRLHKTNQVVVAELASYARKEEPRSHSLPWKLYPNYPSENNKREQEEYNSKVINQFGEWRFEDACLDFEPDVVISITDPWMHEYQFLSPYRRLYKQMVMPTVDSDPQQPEWIAMYNTADKVAAYSTYGKEILEKQSNGRIKVDQVCRCGFDDNNFRIYNNKEELKKEVLLPVPLDANIIGTVMRNQKRKLFDDLFLSFKGFCNKYPKIGENTFLLCHTSYPDNGWAIQRLLKEHGLANKVLFTYICHNCSKIQLSFFNNIVKHCPFCGGPMRFTSTQKGADNEQLGKIYNCMDVYVQYSICEGLGIPPIEAGACGIPVMEVDYSAMEDVVRCLGGTPIKVLKRFRESETHAYRVYPDNDHLVEELYKFFTKPQIDRHVLSLKTKALANKIFSWDNIAQQYLEMINSLKIQGSLWRIPPFFHQPNINLPQQINNANFIDAAITNITGRTDLIGSFLATKMLRDLNAGMKITGYGGGIAYNDLSMFSAFPSYRPYTRQDVVNELLEMNGKMNEAENKRMMKANNKYNKPSWMI